jgi:hypothetical protein
MSTKRNATIAAVPLALFTAAVAQQKGCSESDCQKLAAAVTATCMAEPTSNACATLSQQYEAKCKATPAPSPTAQPTPLPSPSPSPSATPTTPTTTTTTTLPAVSALPESCKSAEVYMGDNYYGQGLDSSVRWRGSEQCCRDLGHQNTSRDCHAEGYPQRLAAELEALGGCPIWQGSVDGKNWFRLEDNQGAPLSGDHFGNTVDRDDPQTPEFEGEPKVCGKQRGQYGPNAGFFVIAHGKGFVRACKPDGTGCGAARAIDY